MILIFVLSGCEKTSEGELEDGCLVFEYSDTYQYPLNPDTREALQIPDDILETISTEGLLESLLNHPYFMDFAAYDSHQLGFNHLSYWSPGIGVLLRRPDFFSVILDRYQNMDMDCEAYYPPIYSDVLQYAFPSIEIFIVQDELIDKLDSTEIHLLFETVREVNLLKIDRVSLFYMGQMESTALMGKILLKVNYSPFVEFYNEHEQISRFVEYIENNGFIIHPRDTINAYAEDYYSLLH
jgi:hypothetical protein